ncbi:MAG TPA: A/G-specific adenine glycosylase [Candidatus Limnocylindrales bacterium]|nr:A/G-specific adenine glycosylase [Candidatus Limnocylindrales bacterium]
MLAGRALIRFRKALLGWFSEFQRDLPWRSSKDPYRIWLSEIMLQQTRVAAAIPYYKRFLERFPNVKALAEAPEEEVLRLWAGLGYYSRARNLQKAAKQIVAEHRSRFPENLEEALALPGIGQYTAAAILSIAHGKKLAVLDGNVARVLARLQAMRGDLRNGARWQALQKTANNLLAPRAPGDWNQAMMELGATLCTPRSPQCLLCPVGEFCEARKQGLTAVIPEKRNKRKNVEVTLAALVLVDPRGNTLLLPPPKSSPKLGVMEDVAVLLSRMWHFPTIRAKHDAERELREFVQKSIWRGKRFPGRFEALANVRHAVTYRQITLQPFRVHVAELPPVPNAKFLPLDDLSSVAISNLTRKVAQAATQPSLLAGLRPRK